MHRNPFHDPRRSLALAVPALLLAACRGPGDDAPAMPQSAEPDTSPSAQVAPTPHPPHVFDPGRVQVGDSVVGMRVTRMNVDTAYDGRSVGSVWFAGEARVSGRYQPHPDSEVNALCFFADAESGVRLPRFAHDERRAWFCFANQDDARRMLGTPPDTGQAAVVIGEYAYHFVYSDGYNEARLVRVEGRRAAEGDGGR